MAKKARKLPEMTAPEPVWGHYQSAMSQLLRKSPPAYGQVDSWGSWQNLAVGWSKPRLILIDMHSCLCFYHCLCLCQTSSNASYPTFTFLGLKVVWSIVFWNPSLSILKQAPFGEYFLAHSLPVLIWWPLGYKELEGFQKTCLIVYFSQQIE